MTPLSLRLMAAALSFGLVFAFGFWLNHSGKPYPVVIFTLHKLIALGALALLTLIVRQTQPAGLGPLHLGLIALAAAAFLTAVISGGLASVARAMPPLVLRLHQISPLVTVLAVAGLLALLLRAGELT